MPEVPVADWVDVGQLTINPYPVYSRLLVESPVAYVPQLDRYLVTSFEGCRQIELDQTTFSSFEEERSSTMIRALGRSMLRHDDPRHQELRAAIAPSLRPKAISESWNDVFHRLADTYISRLKAAGPGADFFTVFAAPYAADALTAILGFDGVSAETMMDWSHTLIRGISNVTRDDEVWVQTDRVRSEIDMVLDKAIQRVQRTPDNSVVSSLVHAHGLSDEDVRNNVRLAISGGMNEPSHVMTSMIWCLTEFPNARAKIESGEATWSQVFEETARFHSPVGMYPRKVTRETELLGVHIPKDATVGVVVAAANRDPSHFNNPDTFVLGREEKTHLAFGNGPHVCAGKWVARAMIRDVVMPRLASEFNALKALIPEETRFTGWVFRGTDNLPVTWNQAN